MAREESDAESMKEMEDGRNEKGRRRAPHRQETTESSFYHIIMHILLTKDKVRSRKFFVHANLLTVSSKVHFELRGSTLVVGPTTRQNDVEARRSVGSLGHARVLCDL
jgi:hypothetical protein